MNVTFLIGNGFDLNLGLKTQYSSFLESYTEVQKKDSELIKQFKRDILTTTNLWANAEAAFGEFTEFFVENGRTAADYCECHEDFCISLGQYLQRQEEQLDFEALKPIIKETFPKSISKYYQHFREAQRQQIEDYIGSVTGGFVYNFLNFNYTKTLDNCIKISKQPGILGKRTRGNYIEDNSFGKQLHVHGYTDREMILGVNDDSQIKSLSLFDEFGSEYKSQIIKSKADKMNEENTEKKAKAILANSDIIYIYGMSIGKTDAQWWQEICGLMSQKKQFT